jgi:hypothetical protein
MRIILFIAATILLLIVLDGSYWQNEYAYIAKGIVSFIALYYVLIDAPYRWKGAVVLLAVFVIYNPIIPIKMTNDITSIATDIASITIFILRGYRNFI